MAIKYFKPKDVSRSGVMFVQAVSNTIGTGGVALTNSGTTVAGIPLCRGKYYVIGVSFQSGSVAAVSSGGVVTARVYRRNVAGAANVALTAATSIKVDFLAATYKAFNVAVTGTDAERTLQPDDILYVDLVAASTVDTAPVGLFICVELGLLE